jgi:hypothetical protein
LVIGLIDCDRAVAIERDSGIGLRRVLEGDKASGSQDDSRYEAEQFVLFHDYLLPHFECR